MDWNICSELFPKAIQIVDLYHAKQRVWDVAKAVYGHQSDLTRQWAKQRLEELDRGDIETLVAVFSQHQEAAEAVGYFDRNRQRMRYASFQEQGLCVSSGAVESACKNVVGARLKQAGMHWSVSGADAILALRCCIKSQRLDDSGIDELTISRICQKFDVER